MCKCRKCGAEIGQNVRFCQVCGAKIKWQTTNTQKKRSLNYIVLIIMIVLILGIGLGIGFYLPNIIEKNKAVDGITTSSMNDSENEYVLNQDSNTGEFTTDDAKEDTGQNAESLEGDNIDINTDLINSYNYVDIGEEVRRKYDYIDKNNPEVLAVEKEYDYVEEWIEGDTEIIRDFNYTGIHFTKAQPRDIRIVNDSLVCGHTINMVRRAKYADDLSSRSKLEVLTEEVCYLECGNVIKFPKEYLMTLEPGYYEFELNLVGDTYATQPVLIIIHDVSEPIVNYRMGFDWNLGFYSTDSKNDVFFYLNGSTSPIKNVIYDEEYVEKNDCEIVCDGYGIILHSEFLEKYSDKPYIKLIIKTETDIELNVKVIFLNHAP